MRSNFNHPQYDFHIESNDDIISELESQGFIHIFRSLNPEQKHQFFKLIMPHLCNTPTNFQQYLSWFLDQIRPIPELSTFADQLQSYWMANITETKAKIQTKERLPHWATKIIDNMHIKFYFTDDSPVSICQDTNPNIIIFDFEREKIGFVSPYVIEWIDFVKSVSGRKWDEIHKLWEIPFTSFSELQNGLPKQTLYSIMASKNIAVRYYGEVFQVYESLLAIRSKVSNFSTETIINVLPLSDSPPLDKSDKKYSLLL